LYGYQALIEDFLKHRPAVVFVDLTPPRWHPPERSMAGFDWLQYLGQDERFRREFTTYSELPRISNYRVFVRTPGN
jgi:hypothetical protein